MFPWRKMGEDVTLTNFIPPRPRIPTVTKNKFRDYRIFRALENLEVPLTRKDVSAEITTIFAVATEVTKAKACEKDPQSGG